MKLLFLGSGSAKAVGTDNFQSNMLFISNSNDTLMLDCGSDARFSLYKQDFSYLDINNVYISHLHADHAGGLEWLALTTKFDPRYPHKPRLFVAETLADELWGNTLSGGLGTLQGEIATLDTYFDVVRVPLNGTFDWAECSFRIVQTVHVMNGFALMPSFGLFCDINGLKVFITTDTQFSPHQFDPLFEQADIIFHDCETGKAKSGVHAHYTQLKGLSAKYKAKMWLYHYGEEKLPDAKADGFLGFVACGQIFDLNNKD